MERNQKLVLFGVGALFVVLIAALFVVPFVRSNATPVPPGDASAVGVRPSSVQPVTAGQPIVWGGGERTARLYIDFHCPHCADFEASHGDVIARAAQDNAIRLQVYPMAFIDSGSRSAANAFGCAAEAGSAQEYFAGLFANVDLRWSATQLTQLGALTGVSAPGFEACVTDQTHAGWVDSINAAAAADQVTQTPSMFVGDQSVDIATVTPEQLDQLLRG